MYQYIYESKHLPANLVIFAANKKEAESVLKELGLENSFFFSERVKK